MVFSANLSLPYFQKVPFKVSHIFFVDFTGGWKTNPKQIDVLTFSSQSPYMSPFISTWPFPKVEEVSF